MTASHEGRYPEPLDSFTADLIRLERMQREIRKTLGAESQKIIDSVLADEADLPSRVFDLLHDLVMNESEIIKSFTGLGDYGEFGINVMKFGGVYWVQAAEFDDIGPGETQMFTKQRYVIRSIAKMIEEGWSEDDARRIAYDAVGEVDAENANAPVDLAQSPNLDHYLKNCPVLDHMHKYGRPLTRETYIALATLGQDEDYHWDHEDEVDVPEPLKDLDEFDPEPRPDKPLKLYEVWNTETHRLGALISAPNLKGAIKEARKAARLYDNMVYSSAKMSVRVAVPENITTEAQKSITQYGYWYAYASAGARCMDDIAEPAADFQHAQDTTKAS